MLDLCKAAADHCAQDDNNRVSIWSRSGTMYVLQDVKVLEDETAISGARPHTPDFGFYMSINAVEAIEFWYGGE